MKVYPINKYQAGSIIFGRKETNMPVVNNNQEVSTTGTSNTDDILDVVKNLKLEGLVSDTNIASRQIQALIDQVQWNNTPGNLSKIYFEISNIINNLKENKNAYDLALKNATSKDSLNDPVQVGNTKRYYALNENGELTTVNREEYDPKNYQLLTSAELSTYRQHNNNFAFNNQIIQDINSSISISELKNKLIKTITSFKQDTRKQTISNKDRKQLENLEIGFDIISGKSSSEIKNIYGAEVTQENLEVYKNLAKRELMSILTDKEQDYLKLVAKNTGLDMNSLLQNMLNFYSEEYISTETTQYKDPSTSGSSSGNTAKKKFDLTFWDLIQQGNGGAPSKFILNPGLAGVMSVDSYNFGQIVDINNKGLGKTTLEEVLAKGLGSFIDTNSMYIGDKKVDQAFTNKIAYLGDNLNRVILPYTVNEDGSVSPDFENLENFSKFLEESKKLQKPDTQQIEELLEYYNVKNYYKKDINGKVILNSNNLPEVDPNKTMPFVVFNVVADGNYIEDPEMSMYLSRLKGNMPDRDAKDFTSSIKSSNKNISDLGSWKELYKGVLYAPLIATGAMSHTISSSGIPDNVYRETLQTDNLQAQENSFKESLTSNL